jgi:hypothetical protein
VELAAKLLCFILQSGELSTIDEWIKLFTALDDLR